MLSTSSKGSVFGVKVKVPHNMDVLDGHNPTYALLVICLLQSPLELLGPGVSKNKGIWRLYVQKGRATNLHCLCDEYVFV